MQFQIITLSRTGWYLACVKCLEPDKEASFNH
jgi:hypothetical protein